MMEGTYINSEDGGAGRPLRLDNPQYDGEEGESYDDFYRQATPRLISFLTHLGFSMADSADCVQEAMIEAYSQWENLEYPYAWCRTLAFRKSGRLLKWGRIEFPHMDPARTGEP